MDPLLDAAQVANWLGISIATLYDQRHRRVGIGNLAIKVGRHLRWRSTDVERWLDQQQASRESVTE
jgi:predicted DNA-binding transcriptional regulator AlpA